MVTFYPDPKDDRLGRPDRSADQLPRPSHLLLPEELLGSPLAIQEIARASSRELKTCASVIAGWTELLSRGLLADQEVELACARIRHACSRITAVAGRLEDLTTEVSHGALDGPTGQSPGTVQHGAP